MQRGFSLVELSIVLVILGLLTGGILAGQSLIRAAELRSVSTELNHHVTAINTFRDKYFAQPGDMTNATKFWGDQATGTGACADAATPDGTPGTCNGNGDGIMDGNLERHRAWQQLAMAGLIEGSFTGIPNAVTAGPNPGENAPRSKLSNAGWDIEYYRPSDYSWVGASTQYVQQLRHGVYGVWSDLDEREMMKPEEMWNIDTKLDDGKPAIGKAFTRYGAACATSNAVSADYLLSGQAKACGLIYKIGQ